MLQKEAITWFFVSELPDRRTSNRERIVRFKYLGNLMIVFPKLRLSSTEKFDCHRHQLRGTRSGLVEQLFKDEIEVVVIDQ